MEVTAAGYKQAALLRKFLVQGCLLFIVIAAVSLNASYSTRNNGLQLFSILLDVIARMGQNRCASRFLYNPCSLMR